MTKYLIAAAILISLAGCTKKEFKTNFHNVKTGVKKDWHQGKQNFSKTTEKYRDH